MIASVQCDFMFASSVSAKGLAIQINWQQLSVDLTRMLIFHMKVKFPFLQFHCIHEF